MFSRRAAGVPAFQLKFGACVRVMGKLGVKSVLTPYSAPSTSRWPNSTSTTTSRRLNLRPQPRKAALTVRTTEGVVLLWNVRLDHDLPFERRT